MKKSKKLIFEHQVIVKLEWTCLDHSTLGGLECQEIRLVTFMFFFELLFSYAPLQITSMFLSLTYSQSLILLSAHYPRHLRQRRSKISIQTNTGTV